MKKLITILLIIVMAVGMIVPAYAENIQSRAVIGADLTDDQIAAVYNAVGIKRGDAIELRVTNGEERQWLQGYVDESLIGTRSISCVYVELLPEGSGMDVTTSNITWCTGEMYISALATAGITDARIIVASPFEVSGTAALTGVYKAYEDMTGKKLDDLAKLVSTQELTITGELANEIGGMDSTSIVNDLKLMLDETQKMTDDEIRAEIIDIAGRYNVSLTNTQIQQLIDLCRSLEGLDADSLKARVEEVHHAKEEGVIFDLLTNPVEILTDENDWVKGIKVVSAMLTGITPQMLRKMGDTIKSMDEPVIAVLAGVSDEKGNLLCPAFLYATCR